MPGTSSPSSALLFIPMAFGSILPRRAVVWVHPAGYTQCPALRSMEKKKKPPEMEHCSIGGFNQINQSLGGSAYNLGKAKDEQGEKNG